MEFDRWCDSSIVRQLDSSTVLEAIQCVNKIRCSWDV